MSQEQAAGLVNEWIHSSDAWAQREALPYVEEAAKILRHANIPPGTPSMGQHNSAYFASMPRTKWMVDGVAK